MNFGRALALILCLLAFEVMDGRAVTPTTAVSALAENTSRGASCGQLIARAVQTLAADEVAYDAQANAWTLTGITGELRSWQVDTRRGDPTFDLVQVYARGSAWPLWAAAGVTLPAWYGVHDAASREQYLQRGHGDQPYYLSFVQGLATRAEIERTFDRPGQYLVQLSVSHPGVSARGIQWNLCQPEFSDYCTLASFFESGLLPAGDGFWPGPSNEFIQGVATPTDPATGFLIWPVILTRQVDLCGPGPAFNQNAGQ